MWLQWAYIDQELNHSALETHTVDQLTRQHAASFQRPAWDNHFTFHWTVFI